MGMEQSWRTSPTSVLRWGLLETVLLKLRISASWKPKGLVGALLPPASGVPQPASAVESQVLPVAGRAQNESLNLPPFLPGLELPSDQQRWPLPAPASLAPPAGIGHCPSTFPGDSTGHGASAMKIETRHFL